MSPEIRMNKEVAQQPLLLKFGIVEQFVQLHKAYGLTICHGQENIRFTIQESFFEESFSFFKVGFLTVENTVKVKQFCSLI
ncbi:hypothetical protein D3C86_1738650 [compost metagenome]